MNQVQLKQLTENLKQTLKKMSEEGRNEEVDLEKIGIIYLRVLKACNYNAALAIQLVIYALMNNHKDTVDFGIKENQIIEIISKK